MSTQKMSSMAILRLKPAARCLVACACSSVSHFAENAAEDELGELSIDCSSFLR